MLADDLFHLAHDDTSHDLRVHGRAVGLGLAAALLGELLYAGRIVIGDGVVRPVGRAAPPADAVAYTVLDQIVAERTRHAVRTWLAFLSEDHPTRVPPPRRPTAVAQVPRPAEGK